MTVQNAEKLYSNDFVYLIKNNIMDFKVCIINLLLIQ